MTPGVIAKASHSMGEAMVRIKIDEIPSCSASLTALVNATGSLISRTSVQQRLGVTTGPYSPSTHLFPYFWTAS